MSFEKIKMDFLCEKQVLKLTLNAPSGNILDMAMMKELCEAIQHTGGTALKALIFEGEGKHFSFGASVQEHTKEKAGEMLALFGELFETIIGAGKPTIAIVRGQCLGGGLELASFCHWIFASEDAKFGQPEINLGVYPPLASLLLPYLVGQSYADDIILSGRTLSAQEAKAMGLVYSLSPDPQKAAGEFIEKNLLTKSPLSLKFACKASRYRMYAGFMRDLKALEKMYVEELMNTEDANEGIASFLEKRKPEWKNK